MRHSKRIIALVSVLLCLAVTAAALADSVLAGLWTSGCNFLFHTNNVTVTGEATFSLNGERFKTAQLHYIQDGRSSFYGLKLLTPKADGTDRETGWTIISDEKGNISVMEAYRPGVYRSGTDDAHNTLLRRTVQLDALTELGGLLVKQAEPLLPEGVVTATETESGRNVHIAVTEDQIPAVAAGALNLAAGYFAGRWFAYVPDGSIDEDGVPFGSYATVTEALANGTVRWTLRSADVDFSLDAQGRLTSARGEARVASTYWDGSVREVEVRFGLTAADYGASHVKPFDPDDYHVAPEDADFGSAVEDAWLNLSQPEKDAWFLKASEILTSLGFALDPDAGISSWGGPDSITIGFTDENGRECFCVFAADGRLRSVDAMAVVADSVREADSADAEAAAEAKKLILAFAGEQNPEMTGRLDALTVRNVMNGVDGSKYLMFGSDDIGYFNVRVEPTLRLEYYCPYFGE